MNNAAPPAEGANAAAAKRGRHWRPALAHISMTILSLILSILLTVTFTLCLLQVTVFDESFLRAQINKSRYETFLRAELMDTLSAYGAADNIGAAVFQGAVTGDIMKADIYREAGVIYAGGEGADAAAVSQGFKTAVYAAMTPPGGSLSADQKAEADNLADKCAAAYMSAVNIPFAGQIHDILLPVKQTNAIGIAGFAAIDAACALVLLFGAKHIVSRRRRSEYIMNAAAGAALILGVPSGYLYFSGLLDRIPITDPALLTLARQYVNAVLQTAGLFVAILAVIFVCCLLYRRAYINAKRNGRRFTLLSHLL